MTGAPLAADAPDIVVTGFRASLNSAINIKRTQTATVDVIKAEDIAEFPDLNLAESLQRIPGVSISRVNGEGRNISVRASAPTIRVSGSTAWRRSAPPAVPIIRAA
ncbi:TonB-dependent receptor plug domain-containing protein [Sphingomonas aerolata]|uniref:TonB-dependent receptor plug domain-containing protein n=1 Tax=Sphingomonas aerolata TaxID=185951 RepID=UPI002FE25323